MSWRIKRGDKMKGPFTGPEILELLQLGKVARGDLISEEFGDDEWSPIETSEAFSSYFAPLPTQIVAQAPAPQYYPQPYAIAVPVFVPMQTPWVCPYCRNQTGTYIESKITSTGWLLFFLLFLFCFPLFWIGLCQTENIIYCRGCRARV